jgi:hypothetical protein
MRTQSLRVFRITSTFLADAGKLQQLRHQEEGRAGESGQVQPIEPALRAS